MKLPDRLLAVAGFVEAGACVVDVGTDHGYLPVYLAINGLAGGIVASDINPGPLEAARRSAARYGLSDRIVFVCAPGLSSVGESDADTIVISGLGGETIVAILEEAPWTKRCGVSLILQPQSKTDLLCCFLRDNGYCVCDAKLALDSGKLYVVMLVRGGESVSSLEPQTELLTLLMNRSDPLFADYIDKLITSARRVLDGRRISGLPDSTDISARLDAYIRLKEEYENANCQ